MRKEPPQVIGIRKGFHLLEKEEMNDVLMKKYAEDQTKLFRNTEKWLTMEGQLKLSSRTLEKYTNPGTNIKEIMNNIQR